MTYHKQKELLNKIYKLLCKCRHANKLFLKNYTGILFKVKTEIKYYFLMIVNTLNPELQ